MTFQKGNQFWKVRSSHGRKPIFETPDDLWKACVEYFEYIDENYWIAPKATKADGTESKAEHPRKVPYTMNGLCLFLDIDPTTWRDYKTKTSDEPKDDFSIVTTRVDSIIYEDKFRGATLDYYNANIIARDLGLKDTKELEHKNLPDVNIYMPDNGRNE